MGFQLYWSISRLPDCFLWNQDLRTKFLGQAPMMGFSWASTEQGFSSGLRTPKWRCLEARLGPHLPLCFMEKFSIDFSLPATEGTAQLHKIKHLVLFEMSCGVWDILVQLTDTTPDLHKILCRINLLQGGTYQLRLQQALSCEQLNSYLL